MRVCVNCKAAENPLSKLRFVDQHDGSAICLNCYPQIELEGISGLDDYVVITCSNGRGSGIHGACYDDYVVITCPNCRGSGIHGAKACAACVRLGVVRISKNSIPIYSQK